YHEDRKGGVLDDKRNESTVYDKASSFRLKSIMDLKKLIKNDFDFVPMVEETDVDMAEIKLANERKTECNKYLARDRENCFYF
ncbi:hypothetical protein BD560DRAFT_317774, partial [Blakeslea trispora]